MLSKYPAHSAFPAGLVLGLTFGQGLLRLGVQVMRFIRNHHYLVATEVFHRNRIFPGELHPGVQPLNGSEVDIDRISIHSIESVHRAYAHGLVVNAQLRGEQMLGRCRVEEVVLGFLDNLSGVHEE